MVGIAGKSKGCHTCRRRKVKCDEGKPLCQRCSKASLICEGYEKRSVFLNKTSHGWMKREHLEEIIPSQESSLNTVHQAALEEIKLTPVWLARIEEYFLEKYLGIGDIVQQASSPGYHVFQILTGIARDGLLESAIKALCLTRFGRMHNDNRFLQPGFASYSLAVKQLYIALSRDTGRYSDATLAAVKIMNVYEFYEPSYRNGGAVYSHTIAVEKLLYGRAMTGHGRRITDTVRGLLKSARYNSMIACIKGYSFTSLFARWKSQMVIADTYDDHLYRLIDIGFAVASIVHHYQRVRERLLAGSPDRNEIWRLSRKCCRAYHTLKEWFNSFAKWGPTILYEPADGSSTDEFSMGLQYLRFANINIAHILNDYWALSIILGWTMHQLAAFLQTSSSFGLHFKNACVQELQELSEQLDIIKIIQYARHILCSVGFCLQSDSGLAGQDHVFGLGIALRFFQMLTTRETQTLEERTITILHTLVEEGLPFAACLIEQAGTRASSTNLPVKDLSVLMEIRWGPYHE